VSRRSAPDRSIRIPRRTFVLAATAVLGVFAIAAIVGLSALARASEPVIVATAAQMKTQQTAAERDVERAYEQATDQVKKVRALNLAITAAQADQIAAKALSDLKNLRHSAFVSLGQIAGTSGADAEAYATVTEQRFDQTPVAKQPSPTPVLLAPRFYTIVSRMSDLATQLADQATTLLTASPAAPPASPTPTARPSASPSPSR
jgi:hypothetical protein